jgi:hypothetical protein
VRNPKSMPKWIFVGKGVYKIAPTCRNSMNRVIFNFFSQKNLLTCNLSSVVIKRSFYKDFCQKIVSCEYFCHNPKNHNDIGNIIGYIERSYSSFLRTITMLRTGCTLDDYTRACSALQLQPFNNPEVVTSPYYESLIRMKMGAYSARTFFIKYFNTPESKLTDYQLYLSQCSEPFWTFSRVGKSITKLSDGREIHIGGEHEDYYDPDFCIYNDVICMNTDINDVICMNTDDFLPLIFIPPRLLDTSFMLLVLLVTR